MSHQSDAHQDYAHAPNPAPPSANPSFELSAGARPVRITVAALRRLPVHTLPGCIIHSTGHAPSGPFDFSGAALGELIYWLAPGDWAAAEVTSDDGFGTRILREEWQDVGDRPILLAYEIDGRPLTREEGLVRLIVPSETDEALRQVKWVGRLALID